MSIDIVFGYLIINLIGLLTFGTGIIIEAGNKFTYSYLSKEIFGIHEELTYVGRMIFYILLLLFIPAILSMYLSIILKDILAIIIKISFKNE